MSLLRGVAEISDRDLGRDSDEVMERRSQAGDLREVKVIATTKSTPPKSTGYSFPQHSYKTIKLTHGIFFESKQTKKKHDTLGTKHIQKKLL